MTGPLPDPPELDPSKLSGSDFSKTRRGFEPTEVRSMLGRAADALRVWAERDSKMASRIEELSRRLDEAERFDEARVTELLGAETARIVTVAREAANDIRAQATAEADELLERSRADAQRTSEGLITAAQTDRAEAAKLRSEAEQAAAALTEQAASEAERVLTEARAEADRLSESAEVEAERLRSEAAEAAEALTSEAESRHGEMIEAATRVLEERTTEAEEAAARIREAADGELDAARATAAAELEAARAEAAGIVEEASEQADRAREEARAAGREMVEEARELRRQMLQDTAERTRSGRQKVEAAKAARTEVLSAIRAVGLDIERAVSDLLDNDHAMRRAADGAAADVPDDVALTVRELEEQLGEPDGIGEVAEALAVRSHGDRAAAGVDEEVGTDLDEQVVSALDEQVVSALDEEVGTDLDEEVGTDLDEEVGTDLDEEVAQAGAEVDPRTADEPEAGAVEVDPDEELDALTAADAGEPAEVMADGPSGDEDSQMASVHDLFERLRSTEDDGSDPAAPIPGDGSGAVDTPAAGPTGAVATLAAGERVTTAGSAPRSDDPGGGVEPANGETSSDVAAAASGEDPGAASDTDRVAVLLDRRDVLLDPSQKLLGRTLKRLLSDEQNEVLDRARRHRKARVDVSDLLDDDDDGAPFVERLSEAYLGAATAGATLWNELSGSGATGAEPSGAEPTGADVTEHLVAQVGELLDLRRAHLRETLESLSESGGDSSELVDRLRSAYRELRTTSVEELAGDLATGGFAVGVSVAAGPDSHWRWVPDNGGLPCADAEDNALEGPVRCGTAFPTGDVLPPAHAGCRCLLVPAEATIGSS